MRSKLSLGQKVRFNRRCVLTTNVPKNSRGYSHTALVLADDDEYSGEGIIEAGTLATVVEYASHGTGSSDTPVVRIQGRLASCHENNLDLA